jgi:hypothetical protein
MVQLHISSNEMDYHKCREGEYLGKKCENGLYKMAAILIYLSLHNSPTRA